MYLIAVHSSYFLKLKKFAGSADKSKSNDVQYTIRKNSMDFCEPWMYNLVGKNCILKNTQDNFNALLILGLKNMRETVQKL